MKENGIEMPEGWTVKVVERKEKEIHLTIPPRPAESAKLSDEDLENVAGGASNAVGFTPWIIN